MCGIVGYIGNRNAVPILLEGIKRLEYRGYDSSGIAIIQNDNALRVYKQAGKIVELERILPESSTLMSTLGIAHTRWATHGEPNSVNAHPHFDPEQKIALIHNGIIENYKVLKQRLVDEGFEFTSETDTEVLVHLIAYFYRDNKDLTLAVRKALKMVEGTFGIAVIAADKPDLLVAARRGSPLILGIGNDEFFITSDVAATIIHTKKVVYIQDNEVVTITREGYELTTLDNQSVNAKISEVDWDLSAIEKGKFEHFMLKEIYEQPTSVGNAFRGRLSDKLSTARLGGFNFSGEDLRQIRWVQIIAAGTSYHAGLIGKYIIESLARIPVMVEIASEYRYRNPIIPRHTLVMVISQSGETADTLAAMREAQAKGAKVYGITNTVGSTIARESNGGTYIHAGTEIGVASTKAFTSQVTVLALLGLLLGRIRNLSPMYGLKFLKAIRKIPDKIQRILDKEAEIIAIAESIKDNDHALYLGRGIHYPVALEGALKLKEISYIHAEGYPAAEMKHGPIALIDENMPVIAIALRDQIYDKIVSNLQEVRARRGRIIGIVNEGDEQVSKFAESTIKIPRTIQPLQPLLSVIPLQMLAYHVARLRGLDVDQPRNLAKSVTVE